MRLKQQPSLLPVLEFKTEAQLRGRRYATTRLSTKPYTIEEKVNRYGRKRPWHSRKTNEEITSDWDLTRVNALRAQVLFYDQQSGFMRFLRRFFSGAGIERLRAQLVYWESKQFLSAYLATKERRESIQVLSGYGVIRPIKINRYIADSIATLEIERVDGELLSWKDFKRAFSLQARTAHPDHGGSDAEFNRINTAAEKIRLLFLSQTYPEQYTSPFSGEVTPFERDFLKKMADFLAQLEAQV